MVTGVSMESRTEHLRTTRQALHLEPYRGIGGRHSDSGVAEDWRIPGCDAMSWASHLFSGSSTPVLTD